MHLDPDPGASKRMNLTDPDPEDWQSRVCDNVVCTRYLGTVNSKARQELELGMMGATNKYKT
jgi:hypothetical protein